MLAKILAPILAHGKATIGVPKPSFAFPAQLMFALFVTGYTCEYLALGRTSLFVSFLFFLSFIFLKGFIYSISVRLFLTLKNNNLKFRVSRGARAS